MKAKVEDTKSHNNKTNNENFSEPMNKSAQLFHKIGKYITSPSITTTIKNGKEQEASVVSETITSTTTKKFNPPSKQNNVDDDKQNETSGTPSQLRQLLPITLCIISFATVLSILIIYIDTTEIRHQQFRLNMSRDYDLLGVEQDNPSLISYIREVQMKKYPNMVTNFMSNPSSDNLNFSNHHELTPKIANKIAELVGEKKDKGLFFQSLTGSSMPMMTAPWLNEIYGWKGYIAEPDPRKYFNLRKENARRKGVEVIHACLSPTGYPKEVTLHHEDENDVKINSILDEESEWFHSRVKCFPLYTLLLAVNHVQIDVLSLGCQGQELEILQTLPWNKVKINVISIHLSHHFEQYPHDAEIYTKQLIKFMRNRSYKLQFMESHNLIFQKIGGK